MIFRTEPHAVTCHHCKQEFTCEWRGKSYCDPCVRLIKARRRTNSDEAAGYRVPPDYRAHGLVKAIGEAVLGAWTLVLYGPPGTGKTCQLHQLLKSRAVQASKARFQPAGNIGPDMLDERQEIMGVPHLAIDDVGRRITPAAIEGLCQILDYRHAEHMPTYLSTNLRLEDVEELDARLASRLSAAKWLLLTGDDKRRSA